MPAPPVPVMYENKNLNTARGSIALGRPVSFRMPNGRVQSVRIGRGTTDTSQNKPLPAHPHLSLKSAVDGVMAANRMRHLLEGETDGTPLVGSAVGVEVEMSSM